MEHSFDEWVSDANEAIEISLVHATPLGLRPIASFHPQFTYSIFNDEQSIFGYQDLRIQLRFNASDMRPNLHVGFSEKLRLAGDNEPTDIDAILKEFLPPVAFQKASEFEEAVKSVVDYTPPGKVYKAFQCSDGRYEIWKGSLADPAVKQLLNRIQIFVPLFIEAGTFINTDGSQAADPADRWTVFFLYRTRQRAGTADKYEYEFAAYSTVYRFLLPVAATTPPRSLKEGDDDNELEELGSARDFSQLPCRSRLSQFVILPPFQGKGHAARLYGAIYNHYLHDEPQTLELTVEDPNEAFDDVRDLADLATLSAHPDFAKAVRIDTSVAIPKTGPSPKNIVDPAVLEALRRQTKIAPRQFHRVVEMYLMQKLAPSVRPTLEEADNDGGGEEKAKQKGTPAPATPKEQHEFKLWRLLVKQRLYRHNKEILGQLERSQRIDKLEETLVSVELEYARILSMFESRAKLAVEKPTTEIAVAASASASKTAAAAPPAREDTPGTKRKLAEEDGDDSLSKKVRVEEA